MDDVQRQAAAENPRFYVQHPACGGTIKQHPEDFQVFEEPIYEPEGSGDHAFFKAKKRDVDHESMLRILVKALDVSRSDIGVAGIKDKHAVTTQWLSVPARAIERIEDFQHPAIELGDITRHRNKLRRGHLRGNRFRCLIRSPEVEPPHQLIEALQSKGVPNFYDTQRFGRHGSTLKGGLRLVQGLQERQPSRSLLRLQLSAVQSLGFNHILRKRIETGRLDVPMLGDLARVRSSGGIFWVDDLDDAAARLSSGVIELTGPMVGVKEKQARDEAGVFETQALEEIGLAPNLFEPWKKLCRGTRRPLMMRALALSVTRVEEGLWVEFSLPAGAYATTILREFTGSSVELQGPA